MTLDEINKEWEKDCVIPLTKLTISSLETPKLHHKYNKMLSAERIRYKKMKSEHDNLVFLKGEYLQGHMSLEAMKERGWKKPNRAFTKTEIPNVIKVDKEIIDSYLRLSYQEEVVETLVSIIKIGIGDRKWLIRNAIERDKFEAGIN